MSFQAEWAVTPAGDVLLAIPGSLGDPPESSRLTALGKLVVVTASGAEHVFNPGRKVGQAIRAGSDILVAEVSDSQGTARTTRIPTRKPPAGRTAGARR